jgi:hypothetical protein
VNDLEVFVVRVYRKDGDGLTGVVEQVDGGQQRSFRGAAALWRALADLLSLDASFESQSNQENAR